MAKAIRAHKVFHTHQNDIWLCIPLKNTLIKYDDILVDKKILSLPVSIYDKALASSKDIIATDKNRKTMIKISPSGCNRPVQVMAPLEPYGICINNRQQIVVAMRSSWGKLPLKLVIYSSDGSTVLYEKENDEEGKPLLRFFIKKLNKTTAVIMW